MRARRTLPSVSDADDALLETELTAEEILLFGPVIEAQVWTPMWVQEQRAPIAVAAGRAKLGKVFDDQGVGKAVIIRPCMSRGRRIRGLPPVYTPRMLEGHAGVFSGWPMFTDHAPPELQAALAKHGRSVSELGGQVLKSGWSKDYVHEDDGSFGYQRGAVIGDVWATPLVRRTVGENPNLLHTSINAWPTSGKPGPVPWRPAVKGMLLEGIRKQPQGSVDFVVRGGAGGKLLALEGLDDEGAWPEVGEWSQEDRAFVVSVAESLYASPRMADLVLPTKPDELQAWLQENAPHLVPALGVTLNEADADEAQVKALMKQGKSLKEAWAQVKQSGGSAQEGEALTEADVRRLIQEQHSGTPTLDEFESRIREQYEATLAERETQRSLAESACALIESAEGIPPRWKADLKARYSMLPTGAPTTLALQESELTDAEGKELSPEQVIEARVTNDLDHVRDLIAEATGKPRVKGEGGAKRDPADAATGKSAASGSFWRQRFKSMGLAESEEKAIELLGGKVEG